jgi:predicted component of type VI protein secretion system
MSGRESPFAKFLTHYDKGQFVFHEGEDGDEMYIIQSGKIAITKEIRNKKTRLTLLEKGDFFGEMSILERLPRTADAEVMETADLITINNQTFGEMIRSNPEIAVRMLRKYSMRMREFSEQMEKAMADSPEPGEFNVPSPDAVPQPTPATMPSDGGKTRAYFIGKTTGKIYPIYKDEVLLGRYDSVTGQRPEIDLTEEDNNRNVSRRHARLLYKDGAYLVAEEIGTMNGTYINGDKLPTGVLSPIKDGDELLLCRVPVIFKIAG